MNTERIRELAIQAGLEFDDDLVLESEPIYFTSQKDIEKFAALVAAEEREACTKMCEDSIDAIFEFSDEIVKETARNVCINLAKGIRARGNE
tara:strand:- start:75 stop:350 length:276 start_codon:yes stop_codon:yes gene_type:complete